MSNLVIKGYNDISFFKEEGIGLIILRSDSRGFIKGTVFRELLEAVSIAYMDDDVKAIAITGINDNFLADVLVDEGRDSMLNMFDAIHTLLRTIYSVRKPFFAIVNGPAINIGYEIALLCDSIIASERAVLGFSGKHKFACLGSITTSRFGIKKPERAQAGINADTVLPYENFIFDSKVRIKEMADISFWLARRMKMSGFETAMMYEKDTHIAQNND